jgi:hypothetical protein
MAASFITWTGQPKAFLKSKFTRPRAKLAARARFGHADIRWRRRFNELDNVVEELKQKEKVDGRKWRE